MLAVVTIPSWTRILALFLLGFMSAVSVLPAQEAKPKSAITWPEATLSLTSTGRPMAHVESLGEYAGVWGSMAKGFEAWAYPFKMFDGLNLEIARRNQADRQPLSRFLVQHTATPHRAHLKFKGSDWTLHMTLFAPRKVPGILVALAGEGKAWDGQEVVLRLRPSLAPMHMTGAEELDQRWDARQHRLEVADTERGLQLLVTLPGARHQGSREGIHEWHLRLDSGKDPALITLAMDWPGGPPAATSIQALMEKTDHLAREAVAHYADLLKRAPSVQSPDAEVNEAMQWSVVSLDQLRLFNPYLGYGLVSGYSASGTGTRPRYCWFFEEPTLTSWAYHQAGLSRHIKESLEFLQRYQRQDGKTIHEVVQSLPFQPDYLAKSPYAYKHTDGPVYYLVAYAHYFRSTGDLEFIRQHWPKILRTLDWCLAAVDPEDGLIRIAEGDWGSAESSTGIWKDTQLEGMWVKALKDTAWLAGYLGESSLAQQCRQAAARAQRSLEAKLWHEEGGSYYWGLDRQGQPRTSLIPHHAISFWLSTLRRDRIERALKTMAGSEFRTDWGVRSLSVSDHKYQPDNYQSGSVWPVWNAGVLISDYRHGRALEGYRNWRSMVQLRRINGLGPMPEALDGRHCRRLPEGVPHQMFSELAVLCGFYNGLLGMNLNVPGRRIEFRPRLPAQWSRLRIDRIPCGPHVLSVSVAKGTNHFQWTLHDTPHAPTNFVVRVTPELPPGCLVSEVLMDGKPVRYELERGSTGTRVIPLVNLDLKDGPRVLRIQHRQGIEFWPEDSPLKEGATSRNLRLVSWQFERQGGQQAWQLQVEGLPGRPYPLIVQTDRPVVESEGGQLSPLGERRYRFLLRIPQETATNAVGYASWNARVLFQ